MTTTNCLKPSVREFGQPGMALVLGGVAAAAFLHVYKITDAKTLAKTTCLMAVSGSVTHNVAMCVYRKWFQKETIDEEDTWECRCIRAAILMISSFVGSGAWAIPQLINAVGMAIIPIQNSLEIAGLMALISGGLELAMPSTKFDLNTNKLNFMNTSIHNTKEPIKYALKNLKDIKDTSTKENPEIAKKIDAAKLLLQYTETTIKNLEKFSKEVDKCSVKENEQANVKAFQDNLKGVQEAYKELKNRLAEIDNIK